MFNWILLRAERRRPLQQDKQTMKTLINKANPAIRVTAPEIIEAEEYYTLDGEIIYLKERWTLVEGIPGWPLVEEEQKPVDLEKAADDYVMQTASGTAEEMETLIDAFKAGAEWMKKQPITFNCIGKQVTMTVQELINYYIDSECVDVADECGF